MSAGKSNGEKAVITANAVLVAKGKMERLSLIRERHQKLVVRHRREIERDLDEFKDEEIEMDVEIPNVIEDSDAE